MIVRSFAARLAVAASLIAAASMAQTPSAQPAYLNPKLPVEQRVDDLVGRMTLEEKASQVVHQAKAIPRLQVPAYNWWHEALHGVVSDHVTVFPEPIGLAATFDTPLIHSMAIAVSREARAQHQRDVNAGRFEGLGLNFWAPNINIFRDPRWGRGQETYGEDPYLTGNMGVAFITGMQGDDPQYYRTIATPKHYAVHSGPEPTRHKANVDVSKHDEEDTYLPAFRMAIVEGKADSIMCAYNSINGEPACANHFLLKDTLRGKWGFKGFVVSDCDAVKDIWRGHHYTKTLEEADAESMKLGTDLDCNEPGGDSSHYVAAVKQGLLPVSVLDTSVKRLMEARIRMGTFDPPSMVSYASIPMSEVEGPEHRALAVKVANESMVLLKNDGTLPLKAGAKKIAVVGPLAEQTSYMWGNYSGKASHSTSVLDGVKAEFGAANVTYAVGTNFLRNMFPVPTEVLRTPDGKPGMFGEYFSGTKLAGNAVLQRVDPNVDFEFSTRGPGTGLGGDNFSVRWSGTLTPPKSGTYKLGFTGDDGFRVWLDGKLIADDWGTHGANTTTVDVSLEQGHAYALKIEYFQGVGRAEARLLWMPASEDPLPQALAAANNADAVVAVVGITSQLEGEEMKVNQPGFEGGDRTKIDLPEEEEAMLKSLAATGKPLVVVLVNGSALAVNWAAAHANAIVEAWYPGQDGGVAVAETLSGKNNPAGRLPVTFYKNVDELPAFTNYSMAGRTYRYFKGDVLYPFGYGLSYSTFAYSGLNVSATQVKAGEPLYAEAEVKNTSGRAGDEVAELYVTYPGKDEAPLRALKGFTRVHLEPGASQRVRFTLTPRDLSLVDAKGNRAVMPGEYRVYVGGTQPVAGAAVESVSFRIDGKMALPE